MSTLTWITDKELERKIKTKGDQFRWKENKKFIAVVRKTENASYHRGENKRQRKKKVNRNTYNILPIKRATRKFLEVSLCSCAKQRHRHMQKKLKKSCFCLVRKKVCCTCKGFLFCFVLFFFFAN